MTQDYIITLPQSEMLTTAALLGYESIFLLSEDQLPNDPGTLLLQLREGLDRLEQKSLLNIPLDGTLQIRRELQAIFACLCQPDTVALVEHNLPAGRKVLCYLLQSGSHILLARKTSPDSYNLTLLAALTPEALFPAALLDAEDSDLQARLPLTQAQHIRSCVESFDEAGGLASLQECLVDKTQAAALLETLSGTGSYLSVRIVRATDFLYKTVFHQLLALPGKQVLRVWADAVDTVHFRGADPRQITAEILGYFQKKEVC